MKHQRTHSRSHPLSSIHTTPKRQQHPTIEKTATETIQGKILVHDRIRVQTEVLPIYFNHASFASLRRQLSYFSFIRVGKGRQGGVTYVNEGVMVLSDILRLKRRTAQSGGGGAAAAKGAAAGKEKSVEQQQPSQSASLEDVASAVLKGTLHAVKTNQYLDTDTAVAAAAASTSATHHHGPSNITSSSVCRTNSTTNSSSASSDNAESTGNNNNGNTDNKDIPRNISPSKLPFKSSDSKRPLSQNKSGSVAISRKDCPRLHRLLYVNNVVPFIHLPPKMKRSKSNEENEDGSITDGNAKVVAAAPPSKKARRGSKQEENTAGTPKSKQHQQRRQHQEELFQHCAARERTTSESAISALLALGVQQ
eukprot:scaffold2556_cov207-Alexandrium_tamarense.AAC.32